MKFPNFCNLGRHIKNQASDIDQIVCIKVAEIIAHGNYNTKTADNDIAILQL